MRELTLMEDTFLNRSRARRALDVPDETCRGPRLRRSRAQLLVVVAACLAICVGIVGPSTRAGAASTTSTVTFVADADAAVYQGTPSSNYGSDATLRTDGGSDPGVETYLRFTVGGVSGTVQSAKLQLSAMSDSTVDGPAVYPTATSWSESGSGGITWNTRPATTGSALADVGAINSNAVVQWDVTHAVPGNGTYSFRLATPSTDGVNFYSRESSNSSLRPVLIVTVATTGTTDTTPPTVSITSPTSGATVSGTIAVSAKAADDVGVAHVDYKVDGSALGSATSSPWGYSIDTTKLSNASHTISATAYDTSENASSSSSVSVAVSNTAPVSSTSCTWYVSSSGSSSNSGTSTTSPLTLASATSKALPGNVVCVMAGTYNLSSSWYVNRSGSAGKYIVFKSYGGTALLKWMGGSGSMVAVTSGTSYVELNGLSIDASNKASSDINCNTAKYVRLIGNSLMNGGAAGISSYRCDYMTVDRNLVYHAGYAAGWSSGISLNTNIWSDNNQGFHIFVTNNIISGTYDNSSAHTDGNGIIMDSGDNTPPVLIANNLVYENYYRCIHSKKVTHVWVVNNTCYKNGLRYNPPDNVAGEINSEGSTDIHVVNNAVYTWSQPRPYKQYNGSVVTYQRNIAWGGTTSEVPASVLSDPNQLRLADPLFVSSLSVNGSTPWATALAPWSVGNSFRTQAGSPLINQGIDPRTATGMTSALLPGITQYLSVDLAGAARPQSGAYDIGAYER